MDQLFLIEMDPKERFKVVFAGDNDLGKKNFILATVWGSSPSFQTAFEKQSKHFIFKEELYAFDLLDIAGWIRFTHYLPTSFSQYGFNSILALSMV